MLKKPAAFRTLSRCTLSSYADIDLSSYADNILSVDNHLYLSPVTDTFTQFIDRVAEWNSTVSHIDLMSDTCFKSTYIVKNIADNYDRLQSFGYWLLTDLHEENLLPAQLFHGGLGLFTYNNIKKPGYHAFFLLNKLGDQLIARGDGYLITKAGDTRYQILLYNYHHYDDVYANGISISITYRERYSHFLSKSSREFTFELFGLHGRFELTHSIVNRQYGSAFDHMIQMGQTEADVYEEDTDYLKRI